MSARRFSLRLRGGFRLPLYMVRVAGLDGHGPIELLQEDEAAQFMGQGEAGQRQALGGGGQGRLVQAPVAADEEDQGGGIPAPAR